jgi:hypothetical protein
MSRWVAPEYSGLSAWLTRTAVFRSLLMRQPFYLILRTLANVAGKVVQLLGSGRASNAGCVVKGMHKR